MTADMLRRILKGSSRLIGQNQTLTKMLGAITMAALVVFSGCSNPAITTPTTAATSTTSSMATASKSEGTSTSTSTPSAVLTSTSSVVNQANATTTTAAEKTASSATTPASTAKPSTALGASGYFGANGFNFYHAYVNDQTPGDPLETVTTYFASEASSIAKAGIGWNRTLGPSNGQFRRAIIEKSQGVYDWSLPDAFVKVVQEHGLYLDAMVDTWTFWDQPGVLAAGRWGRKPSNMAAWKAFVQAMVERYDGDGQADMPGLRYGIKYWEIGNEPEIYYYGNVQEYLDTLKAAYEAVKAADPDSKVLNGGACPVYNVTTGQLDSQIEGFWKQLFVLGGGDYMDILSIHHTCPNPAPPPLVDFLDRFTGYGKDIWVTEFGTYSGEPLAGGTKMPAQTEEYQANYLVKNSVAGFAHGMKKLFWTVYRRQSSPNDPANTWTWAVSMIKADGTGKLVYFAQQVLSTKIDGFSSAQELGNGQYKFVVNGKPVYVLWGAGQIPAELSGQARVTDLRGNETRVMVSDLRLTDTPVFVEP